MTIRLIGEIRDGRVRFGRRRENESPKIGVGRALSTVNEALFEAYGRRGLQQAAERMDMLRELLVSHDLPLTIVVYPWLDQVASDSPSSRYVHFWRVWAQKRGVGFVNLFPPFFPEGEDTETVLRRYYIPRDVHFNAAGNRLIAESFLGHFEADLERRLRDHAGRVPEGILE